MMRMKKGYGSQKRREPLAVSQPISVRGTYKGAEPN